MTDLIATFKYHYWIYNKNSYILTLKDVHNALMKRNSLTLKDINNGLMQHSPVFTSYDSLITSFYNEMFDILPHIEKYASDYWLNAELIERPFSFYCRCKICKPDIQK